MTEYFNIKEIAEKMRVSERTVWSLIKEGKLDTYTVGIGRGKRVATQEQIDKCVQGDDSND